MGRKSFREIRVVDSHTGGEPTRVVVQGGPSLGEGDLKSRLAMFRERHDAFRSAVVNEPRGCDAIVGAILCEPVDSASATGVIFFNNVGYLGMCVHGTIGLVASLAHLGRISPGVLKLETPVGPIQAVLHDDNRVTVQNVPSRRTQTGVKIEVDGVGPVVGDVAWGGNWFFLASEHSEEIIPANIERLTHATWAIRQALVRSGITGEDGGEIDHIELFSPPIASGADSKNFVLCPGKAYDRSPCGTGTSAKLACLAADEKLSPGQIWRQESIIGSIFEGRYEPAEDAGQIIPHITGSAYITAETTLLVDADDPFRDGIRLQ